jgi:hypothetical protein
MKKEPRRISFALRHPRKYIIDILRKDSPPSAPSEPQPEASALRTWADAVPLPGPPRPDEPWTATEQAYLKKNFTPIGTFAEEDIFIASYPRSGNTWFSHMVAGIVYGVLQSRAQSMLLYDLIPDIDINPIYKRFRTPTFFKTHHLPKPRYRNVVYLLRDGRDAMVSYWHYRQVMEKRQIDFAKMVEQAEGLHPCKWHEHVRAWTANPYDARLLILKYEDLLARPVQEMQRFCETFQVPYDKSFLETVIEHSTFDKLCTMEDRFYDPRFHDAGTKFFRRGKAGSYRDEMPLNVQQAFEAQAGDVLREQHYID